MFFNWYKVSWFVICAVVLVTMAVTVLHRPAWGDEVHILKTIHLFGTSRWFQVVRDYPEVTPPLFYAVYATWGNIFGQDLATLRVLSLLLAAAVFSLLFSVVYHFVQNSKTTLILCLCFLLNPYVLGICGFVFTDLLTLLFVLCAVFAFQKEHFELAAVFIGLGMLCRQYVLFFSLAMWATILVRDLNGRSNNRRCLRFAVTTMVSTLPLFACMYLWKGIAPPMGAKPFIIPNGALWNPSALSTYLVFSGIYLLPIVLVIARRSAQHWKLLLPAMGIGTYSLLFPVKASPATRAQTSYDTVGLVHRGIEHLVGHGLIETMIFFVFCTLGSWILIVCVLQDIADLRQGTPGNPVLGSFCFYAFLVVMPFSYQVWEKYLVLVLWLISTRLILVCFGQGGTLPDQHDGNSNGTRALLRRAAASSNILELR